MKAVQSALLFSSLEFSTSAEVCSDQVETEFKAKFFDAVDVKQQECVASVAEDKGLSKDEEIDVYCSKDGPCHEWYVANNEFVDFPGCTIDGHDVGEYWGSMYKAVKEGWPEICSSGQKPGPPLNVILTGLLSLAYLAM